MKKGGKTKLVESLFVVLLLAVAYIIRNDIGKKEIVLTDTHKDYIIPSVPPALNTPLSSSAPTPVRLNPSQTKKFPVPTKAKEIVAKKVGEDIFEISRNFSDEKMATSQDIFLALNAYRNQKGRGSLSWDSNLSEYARHRATYYVEIKKTDAHAGFKEFLKKPDFQAYKQLGFGILGESSAYLNQGPLSGENIIFKLFSADSEHNAQQLDPDYSHVGIAVVGNAIELVFGGSKI